MSLGKVPMKVGGGAKQHVSLKQGVPASMATQRAATTITLRHTEKLSGVTNLYTHQGQPGGRGGKGRGKLLHKCIIARPPTVSMCHLKLSENPYVEYMCMIHKHHSPALA